MPPGASRDVLGAPRDHHAARGQALGPGGGVLRADRQGDGVLAKSFVTPTIATSSCAARGPESVSRLVGRECRGGPLSWPVARATSPRRRIGASPEMKVGG